MSGGREKPAVRGLGVRGSTVLIFSLQGLEGDISTCPLYYKLLLVQVTGKPTLTG